MDAPVTDGPFKVVVAGGGVAGLEALLALHALGHPRLKLTLLCPEDEFTYRPLWVAEPFDLSHPARIPLRPLLEQTGARRVAGSLASVDPDARVVRTVAGDQLAYDALLIAVGTRALPTIEGALSFGSKAAVTEFIGLLDEVERGAVRDLVFAVPGGVTWPLPLYELALLTADRLRRTGREDVRLTVVTHEAEPMQLFRRAGARQVAELLHEAGIRLRTGFSVREFDGERVESYDGRQISADRVVALPRLEVQPLEGVPQNELGFFPTDLYGRVLGVDGIYAAGDATWFPIKQGGIATQQADASVTAIAHDAGLPVELQPPERVLRAALVTGGSADYLRVDLGRKAQATTADSTLWWPPGKIAGRHLGPWLAHREGTVFPPEPLYDLAPYRAEDPEAADAAQQEALALALAAADAEAGWEDYRTALRWLDVAEQLNIVLPPEYADRRTRWETAAEHAGA